MVEVCWRQLPAEYRPALQPMLEAHLHLLPTWCHEVVVAYDDGGESTKTMATTVEKEYRRVHLCISPGWLNRSENRRLEVLIHEVVHVHLEPIQNMVTDLLQALEAKAPEMMQDWFEEQRRYAQEETTCDLTRLITSLLGIPLAPDI